MEKGTIDGVAAEPDTEDFRIAKHVAAVGLEACSDAMPNCVNSEICVKRVGQLDHTVWAQVWSQIFPSHKVADEHSGDEHKQAEMTSIWEDFVVEKQAWSGVVAALIRNQGQGFLGEEIHEAVVASMKEVDQLVGNAQCFPQLKAWNRRQDREATLGEVIRHLFDLLEEQDDTIETLVLKIESQNEEIARSRPPGADTESCQVKGQFFKVQEDEMKWKERQQQGELAVDEPELEINWVAPIVFTDEEAAEFLSQRVAEKSQVGPAGEMVEARDAAFQALLKHGSPSGIGVQELGFLGLETEDDVAQYFTDILVRYQLVEFPHHMKPLNRPPRYPLPEGYSEELRAMGGTRHYTSRAVAAEEIAMAAQTSCLDCKFDTEVNDDLTSKVLYCRKCLGPMVWNYKQRREARVSEAMTYLIGAFLYRQRQVLFMEMASEVQMGKGIPDKFKSLKVK